MTPLSPEALAKLNALANGTFECKLPTQPIIIETRQADPGCEESCKVAPTKQTVPIDVANANQAQCGILPLYIDMTSTTLPATSRQLFLGGCLGSGVATIPAEFFGFPATANLWDLDLANVVGGKSANLNPVDFGDWLQCQIENNNMTFNGFTAENLGGATSLDAFNTFTAQRFGTATLDPWNSWGNCQSGRNRLMCAPCGDNENVAKVTGLIGVSARAAFSAIIPADLNVVIEFCVLTYEGGRNMTTC